MEEKGLKKGRFRSKGFFGLSIWLYHFRDGFQFNDNNPGTGDGSGWSGSTLTIKGAYAWSDIYPYAKEKGVIAVGGNQNVRVFVHPL